MRLSARLAESSLGGKVFLCNSGAEANEAAIKLVRRARPGGGIVVVAAGVPRPHLRGAVGDPAGVQAGAVRAAGPRVRGRAEGPRGAGRRRRLGHRGGAARADPGGDRDQRSLRRAAADGARGLRPDRGGAGVRRDPVRDGAHRHAVGLRADRRRPGRDDLGQGARRRAADRRADHRRAARRRVRSSATTARPSPAARSWPRRRWSRSTSARTRRCWRACVELGRAAARRAWSRCRTWPRSAGAG